MKNRFFFIFILYVFSYTLLFAQETETAKTTRRLQFIEDFIATYEASYEKKKIDYIEKFFSNNALIITETKDLKLAGKALSPRVKKDRPYKSIIEDKDKYIKRLKAIFNQNHSVKLSLANIRKKQHFKYKEIYGVSFNQIWKDQNGGDNIENKMPGYIFLIIDFKGRELKPKIYVRTWQPLENIKKATDKYNLMDFTFE